MPFSGECISVESYEGVLGAVFLETVVEGEKAGEVFCVGDESSPDCVTSTICFQSSGKLHAYLSLTP